MIKVLVSITPPLLHSHLMYSPVSTIPTYYMNVSLDPNQVQLD